MRKSISETKDTILVILPCDEIRVQKRLFDEDASRALVDKNLL